MNDCIKFNGNLRLECYLKWEWDDNKLLQPPYFLQKMITCYPEPSFLLRTSLFYLLQIKHDFIWRKGKIVDDLFFESQIVRTLKVVKKTDAFVLCVPKILNKYKMCFSISQGYTFLSTRTPITIIISSNQ